MENNNNALSEFCSNGCGFYSNPVYNNMCSKCFKESQGTDKSAKELAELLPPIPAVEVKAKVPDNDAVPSEPSFTPADVNNDNLSPPVVAAVQANKAKCYLCRGKVPLAKQTINKCRCQFVFCDMHRFPDKHDCEVDIVKIDRDNLLKNNPKLHSKPKAGRSFTRAD